MNTTQLAVILILLIVLFSIVTQRLLLSDQLNQPSQPKHGKFEKLSLFIANRNESLQLAADTMKEKGTMLWNKIADFTPTWSIANDDINVTDNNITLSVPIRQIKVEKQDREATAQQQFTIAPNFVPETLLTVIQQTAVREQAISILQQPAATTSPISRTVELESNLSISPVERVVEDIDVPLDLIPPPLPEIMKRKPRNDKVKAKQASTTIGPPNIKSQKEESLLDHIRHNHTHPRVSPRAGTHIGEEHQLALLKCPNQSQCIVPQLQLKLKLKVYLCSHPTRQGIRYYFLAKEGLLLHPNVELLDRIEDADSADFVVYLPGSAPWHLTECTNKSLAKKLIVLDEFDGHTPFYPRKTAQEMKAEYGKRMIWYFMYFKRSFVARMDGRFLRYPMLELPDVYPLTYSIAETYVQHNFNFVREVEILCTLRGSASMTTRQRVQDWIAEYATNRSITNVITGEVTKDSRQKVSKMYFQHMYNSKIIVTVNPANWEGDFRLWESMASGALIMVDPLFVPHPFPLIDGVHVVYFNNQKKDELFEKLDYYRAHPEKARKIAINGYLHAMKYHRTVSMIDYVLRSAHLKRATMKNTLPLPSYYYTGQYLNYEAARQAAVIKSTDKPGVFGLHVMYNHTHLQ